MNIEELLYPEERVKIKKITEAQKVILERRESIKRIVNGGNIKNNRKGKSSKNNKDNSNAYMLFLKKEGFLNKEKTLKKEEKKYISESDNINKIFLDICSNVYNKTSDIYGDLMNGLSNINKIKEIITGLSLIEKKLILCKICKNLDYNLRERYKVLLYNLSKLIKVLNESKLDIVDYYSNKVNIFKLLQTIVNSSKNLISILK